MRLILKIMFLPFSVGGGLLAGFAGKKLFELFWGLIDEEEPPEPEHRRITLWKLAAALAIEGAVFRAVRGLVDHFSREGFAHLTGSWPGEEEPEPN
jgi:Protein of unknown function (DUF4235)